MIDVMAIKLKVIESACGICALSEAELLQRLEQLYIDGIAEGVRLSKEIVDLGSPAAVTGGDQ